MSKKTYDAVVIGSGPNGLAAAIKLAQEGLSVAIFEAETTVGGGMRSTELTLPGFIHDICSAIHPLAINSPFFRTLPLHKHGLEWIHPEAPLAHPYDDGTVAILERSIDATSLTLGRDARAYQNLISPLVKHWATISDDVFAPLHLPSHPLLLARFGFQGIRSVESLSQRFFTGMQAKGLFAGLAAHSILPLDQPLTAAFGLILATLGHTAGWPIAKGGSQNIANALASYFRSIGGEIFTDTPITTLDQLSSDIILCDAGPRQLLKMAAERLPITYREKLAAYRYGPGVFKIDWALNNPIPWKAKECLRVGTIHIGGSASEIAQSESEVWQGRISHKPFILLSQPSLFDTTRAPANMHTAWAYCHVPNSSNVDMTEIIESQIERFAPGFRDCILARNTKSAKQMESYNPNYVGGDIVGGVQDIYQLYARPVSPFSPYTTPIKGLYLCSSSTPPGGGVHGMCGYHAACAAFNHR